MIKQQKNQQAIDINPQLAIIIKQTLEKYKVELISQQLKQQGFKTIITRSLDLKQDIILIELSNYEIIFKESQSLQIIKNEKIFINQEYSQGSENGDYSLKKQKQELFEKKKKIILDQIDTRIYKYEQYKVIDAVIFNNYLQKNQDINALLNTFTSAERIRITYSYLQKVQIYDLKIMKYLFEQKYIKDIIPLHDHKYSLDGSLQSIEDYYGENVSVYFEFLNFYQSKLKILFFISIFVTFVQAFFQDKYQKVALQYSNSIYSLCVCIWCSYFYISWQRYESELQVKWGVLAKKIYKEDHNFDFQGTKRIKCTTFKEEEGYSKTKRFYLYIMSLIESLPLLITALIVKILIFNLNGLIKDPESMFFIEQISKLTQQGGLLEKIWMKEQILNVLMIALIIIINNYYTTVCLQSSKRENHRTNYNFHNSLIIKRFFFDLVNRFTHFIFIAFIIKDMDNLKSLLNSLFLMDQIRKTFSESLLPYIIKTNVKRKSSQSNEKEQPLTEYVKELELCKYDDFDDYIEVIAQIGFICLFGYVSRFAVIFSFIFNFFEMKSDKFKIQQKLYQRSLPYKIQGIGAWNFVVRSMGFLCIYTNITFFSLDFFEFFDKNDQKKINAVENQQEDVSWMKCFLCILIIEHFVLFIKIVAEQFISLQPKWVRVFKRRMNLSNPQIVFE